MVVAVLAGDGVGPEVIGEAVRVLKALQRHGVHVELIEAPIGGVANDRFGDPLPQSTLDLALSADAVLFGAVGGPQFAHVPRGKRPGDGLLRLRKSLGLYANIRPSRIFPELIGVSTLKPEMVRDLDLVVIRELIGDVLFGEPRYVGKTEQGLRIGVNTMIYREDEIERIARFAFQMAQTRRNKVCSIDKANVLETSELWREVVSEVGRCYPQVELSHMYVDDAAMALVRRPTQFDVIVTGNLFGDILSDEAVMLTGSMGVLPSASLGAEKAALYEPVHGASNAIAGKNQANPLGAILSAAMMLRQSLNLAESSERIEKSVRKVLAAGLRTPDIAEPGCQHVVSTTEMGMAVAEAL